MPENNIENVFGNKIRVRVCGICIKDEKILLVKHIDIGEEGILWSPPGGGLIFEENCCSALKREFLEETGFIIKINEFLFVNEFINNPLHAIELFFKVEIVSGKLTIGTEPEIEKQILSEVKWVSLDELNNIKLTQKHKIFNNLDSFSSLFAKKGYFNV